MSADDPDWWDELTTAALVGTARRPPPDPPAWAPARPGATAEDRLLDVAALGGMLRRAGRRPAVHDDLPAPAAPDSLPVAPPRAHQLLDLLLTQTPVGAALTPSLVAAWFATARRLGRRVSHERVVDVLLLAHAHPELRPDARAVVAERGEWLAGFEPRWSWVLGEPGTPGSPGTAEPWATLPAADRLHELTSTRRHDPTAGRALVESAWPTAPAAERADLLRRLATGLGPDDEPLLEAALDDRGRAVREAAWELLDALPASARAQRMEARLRALLRRPGRLRPGLQSGVRGGRLEIELPSTPDAAAVRDGLVPGPRGRSERGFWLERIAAGAPLSVWTDVSRGSAEAVVRSTTELDALVGIRAATLARGDVEWARALTAASWDPAILRLVPAAEREEQAIAHLRRCTDAAQVGRVVGGTPPPWGPDWSRAVVARLAADPALCDTVLVRHGTPLVVTLATGLHPTTLPLLQRWAADRGPGDRVAQVAQYVALTTSLEETFHD